MKTFFTVVLTALLGLGFSTANAADQTEYQQIDTFSVHRNISTNNKIEFQIGGAKNGAVAEVLNYLIKAEVPRANVEGDLIFRGLKNFRISLRYFSINMLIEGTDYFAASTHDTELYKKESLGIVSVLSFGGAQAKFLAEQMERAGVKKVAFKGDANSFTLTGKLVECKNSEGNMGYVCELTMPLDSSKY